MGIFNVGGPGMVRAGDAVFELDYKEALYLGAGDREVTLKAKMPACPPSFISIPLPHIVIIPIKDYQGRCHRCRNGLVGRL